MRRFVQGFESLAHDVRYGARLLWQSPWFSLVGILSLALGLGGGVALFTLMNAAILRPLPGRGTADIHAIHTSNRDGTGHGSSSFADFRSFTSVDGLITAGCATTNVRANIVDAGRPQAVAGALVNGGCFDALGVRPQLGRLLNGSDDNPASDSIPVVISHTLWTRSFGGDPGVVGRPVVVNGVAAVIAGVAERGFAGVSFDGGAEFWAPPPLAAVLLSPDVLTARGHRQFGVYVRLREGVTARQASERLSALGARLREEDPRAWTQTNGSPRTVTVRPELEARFGDNTSASTEIAIGALGAIAAIVLIACVNLAAMVTARGAARTRELNVRLALGASRMRLLRQLATESLLLSAAGVAAGVLVVGVLLRLFDAYKPAEVPAFNVAVDWRVAGFAVLLAIAAPLVFALAPAAHALRLAVAEGLKGWQAAARSRRLRVGPWELLLTAQIIVSFALLVMATLFMRSLMPAADSAATDARQITTIPVDLEIAARSAAEMRGMTARLLQATQGVPDVENLTAAALVPMTGSRMETAGRPAEWPAGSDVSMHTNMVAPGYLELTGTALRAGRAFEARDDDRGPKVAIVSESMSRRLWNSTAAVGRVVQIRDTPWTIVGVVADVPYWSETDTVHPVIYLPLAQSARDRFVVHARVRNHGEAVAALDRALRSVDARIVVGRAMPLSEAKEQVKIGARVAQLVGGVAGVLQLGLALMAIWGLVAYAVERRTVEIGIRRALGATGSGIVRLIMRPSVVLLAAGGIIGSAAGAVAAKVMQSNFLGLAPIELPLVLPAAVLVGAVVLTATWLAARRAASIEPAAALKQM